MQVTNIEVSFKRTRQPAQYETSGAEVKWAVALEDGEDAVKVTEAAIGQVKSIVLAELGLTKPGTNASAAQVASTAKPEPAPKTEKPAKAKADPKPKDDEPQIRSNPENRVDPAQANNGPADIPDEPTPVKAGAAETKAAVASASGDVTVQELHSLVHQYVSEGKIDKPTVKEISRKKFNVERIADIPAEKLGEYKLALETAVAAFAGAADI